MEVAVDGEAVKKDLVPPPLMCKLMEDVRCKPLFKALLGVWTSKFADRYILKSTTADVMVAQFMMMLLGNTIIIDEATGKVKSCPGTDQVRSAEQQFEDWAMDLLNKARGQTESDSASATAPAGEVAKEDEVEEVASEHVSSDPKKSDE